jgi:hypothetical protein
MEFRRRLTHFPRVKLDTGNVSSNPKLGDVCHSAPRSIHCGCYPHCRGGVFKCTTGYLKLHSIHSASAPLPFWEDPPPPSFRQRGTSARSRKTANSAGSSTNRDTASSCLLPPLRPHLRPALCVALELSPRLLGHRHQRSHCPNCPHVSVHHFPPILLQGRNARRGMKLTNGRCSQVHRVHHFFTCSVLTRQPRALAHRQFDVKTTISLRRSTKELPRHPPSRTHAQLVVYDCMCKLSLAWHGRHYSQTALYLLVLQSQPGTPLGESSKLRSG